MRPSMRLSTLNLCALIFMALGLPFIAFGVWSLHASLRGANEAAALERTVHHMGDDLKDGSDYLTDQVRAFVVTRRAENLNQFWMEVDAVKRRDKAIEGLARIDNDASERAFLEAAKKESDALILTETKAMRLACDALGWKEAEMPLAVAALRLGPAEAGLPAREKLDLARDLVFGASYIASKTSIMAKIEDFNLAAQTRMDRSIATARRRADILFIILVALVAVGFVAGAFIVGTYYAMVGEPIRHYTEILGKEAVLGTKGHAGSSAMPLLDPRGTREVAALAEAFNRRRAERLEFETALRDSERRIATHLRMTPLGAIEIDETNRITSWNPAAAEMFGWTEDEAVGKDVVALIVPERFRGEIGDIIGRLSEGETIRTNTNRNLRKDGREIICEWFNTPLLDSRDRLIGWASMVKDITAQREEEEKILWLSHHDPLTGLLNRRRLLDKFEEERLRSRRSGQAWATVMVDVDFFKAFNDKYGHECGDLVLVAVSDAMRDSVRATDSVGRWGGEEFLVILPETAKSGALELAEKIRRRIESLRVAYAGGELGVTVTAGVSICADSSESADSCIRRADGALLAAKEAGRNRTRVAD